MIIVDATEDHLQSMWLRLLSEHEHLILPEEVIILRYVYESKEPVSRKDLNAALSDQVHWRTLKIYPEGLVTKRLLRQPKRGWFARPR